MIKNSTVRCWPVYKKQQKYSIQSSSANSTAIGVYLSSHTATAAATAGLLHFLLAFLDAQDLLPIISIEYT